MIAKNSSMKREVQLEPPVPQNLGDSDPLLENQDEEEEDDDGERKEVECLGSSSEIKSEDIEAGSLPSCRICLESDSEPGEKIGLVLFLLRLVKSCSLVRCICGCLFHSKKVLILWTS